MTILRIVVAAFGLLLGLIHALRGFVWVRFPYETEVPDEQAETGRGTLQDPRMMRVPKWARGTFGMGGVVVMVGSVLLGFGLEVGLGIYAAGWLVIQALAIYNGFTAYGNLRWSHHLARFAVFGAVFGLGLWSLS
jgi:hypothetical protein